MNLSYGLIFGILIDLIRNYKGRIILLLMLFITMLSIVYVTYQTRLLIIKKNDLNFQIQRLDQEEINLKVEETTLMHKNHIEYMAKDVLKMQDIDVNQEILLRE